MGPPPRPTPHRRTHALHPPDVVRKMVKPAGGIIPIDEIIAEAPSTPGEVIKVLQRNIDGSGYIEVRWGSCREIGTIYAVFIFGNVNSFGLPANKLYKEGMA